MKKNVIFSLLITITLICSNFAGVYANKNDNLENVKTKNFSDIIKSNDISKEKTNILVEHNDSKNAKKMIKENKKAFKDYLKNGNMIITLNDEGNDPISLNDELNFPFSVTDLAEEKNDAEENENLKGKLASTLYYLDSNGKPVIHDIMVSENTDEKNYKDIVLKKINEIKNEEDEDNDENEIATMVSNRLLGCINASAGNFMIASTDYETEYLGYYRVDYESEPYGELEVKYKFYTLQDYGDEDYYFIKAYVNGNPGCVLAEDDDDYDEDFQGEELKVKFKAEDDEYRDEYAPHRTIGSKSYSATIGTSLSSDGVTVDGSFSKSYSIDDTDINVTSTSSTTEWDVVYDDDAQLQTNSFCPCISFCTDEDEDFAEFYTRSRYYVDAWNDSRKIISITKYISCDPEDIY